MSANTKNAPNVMPHTPAAKPSRPSMRLMMLANATSQNTVMGHDMKPK